MSDLYLVHLMDTKWDVDFFGGGLETLINPLREIRTLQLTHHLAVNTHTHTHMYVYTDTRTPMYTHIYIQYVRSFPPFHVNSVQYIPHHHKAILDY